MSKPRRGILRQDFAVFGDVGFLVTLALVLLLLGIGTGILIWTSEKYSIPISPYWS